MKAKLSVVLALVLVVCAFAFTSCASPEEKIVGTWKTQQTTLGVVTESSITFNADATGTVSGLLGITGNITYVINEEYLTLTYNVLGVDNAVTYQFVIEGEELHLTKDATTVIYTKVV